MSAVSSPNTKAACLVRDAICALRDKSPGRRIKDFLEYIWRRLGSLISTTICYLQILHFQRSMEWHKRLLFLIISSINI